MWHRYTYIIQNSDTQTCLAGIICANDTFIAIYGVIFTIVISLGVYIYGLQNREEKITLLKSTDIRGVIESSIGFFALTFFALPSPFYEVVNFIFLGWILLKLLGAFKEVFKFNESELSGERAVKKFKEGVIREKLAQFEDLKKKNELLNEELEKKRGKEIERFLFSENNDSYHLIRAQSSGYITDIDLNILFANEDSKDSSGNYSYYIPYHISHGAPIDFDTVILGIKKDRDKKIDEDRLRSFISISDEYENPTSYIEAETRNYYPEMISLIKLEDAKSLELKLKEFSSFVDHFTAKADSYVDIIQFINDDIIFTLQKYAFKQGNVDCIRKVVSFSLGYVYQALDKKSTKTFNIFFRNFGHAFYEAFSLNKKERDEFFDIYFRWLNEVAKYSLKSRLKKDDDYSEFVATFLSGVNGWLKIAFDRRDLDVFEKTLLFLNHSFSRETYEHDKDDLLDEAILSKKAVIFGFTAWVYKIFLTKKSDKFYRDALSKLLSAISKDPIRHYANNQDDLNYYLNLYLKSAELSESKGSFGWDSWGMPEGSVYTVTIRYDIKNLLADRILSIVSVNPGLTVDIKDKNYNDELSLIKEGNQQFDILLNKTKDSFFSTENLTDDQFNATKTKFYEVFSKITEKYESDVRSKLIQQSIDDTKFNEFVKQNFESYKKSRVLYNIQKFIKDSTKKSDGFGYNTLLLKEQFVKETNVHYSNGDQFGEDLARSEDNKILESIYKKTKNIPLIDREKIGENISPDSDTTSIVLWLNGYLSIESYSPNDFVPYWQEVNSRKDKGPYYQGTIKGIPVFIIYKFQDQKTYPDSMFIFKSGAFSVHEFEIEKDTELDDADTKWASDEENCLTLSITNLSSLDDARKKIVENWMQKDPSSVKDKDAKIEELKTNVIFKFYKGLSSDELTVDDTKVKIFTIK
jgi:hypothetical protein